MDSLLTTRQVQDYLKVDRTTIYRMLKDGRLPGIRVGNQWRFSREAIDALTVVAEPHGDDNNESQTSFLPIGYLQPIQDVFADIAQVSSLTTGPDGTPLTSVSNTCEFCALILASESGRRACVDSWRRLAQQPETSPSFVECHAGLLYARARIELNGRLEAMAIAGQFTLDRPTDDQLEERILRLASRHRLDPDKLRKASAGIPVIERRMVPQIGAWLQKIARTFERLGRERLDLMGRLRKIAAITANEQ